MEYFASFRLILHATKRTIFSGTPLLQFRHQLLYAGLQFLGIARAVDLEQEKGVGLVERRGELIAVGMETLGLMGLEDHQ